MNTSLTASIKPQSRMIDASERREDLLSPRAMGGFLAQLIAEADRPGPGSPTRRSRRTPHVVAPDVGTSAAVAFLARKEGRAGS